MCRFKICANILHGPRRTMPRKGVHLVQKVDQKKDLSMVKGVRSLSVCRKKNIFSFLYYKVQKELLGLDL